jgi:hypothetical protein
MKPEKERPLTQITVNRLAPFLSAKDGKPRAPFAVKGEDGKLAKCFQLVLEDEEGREVARLKLRRGSPPCCSIVIETALNARFTVENKYPREKA